MPSMRALASVWLAAPALLVAATADGRGAVGERAEAFDGSSHAGAPKDSPVGKVLELLIELGSQLQEDKVADGAQFHKYLAWYQGESGSATTVINDTTRSVESLQTELDQQEAFREGQNLVVQEAIADLAKVEKELQKATSERGVEHKSFADNEAQVVKGIQQLEHSLTVMGQPPSAQGGSQSSTSLVDVAKKVKSVLLQGADFHLTLAQRETIAGFMRAALRRSRPAASGGLRGANGEEVLAPDFLQVDDLTTGPYGQYQRQSSGVVSALQSVLDKAKKHLDDLRSTEQTQSSDFKIYEQEIQKQISVLKGILANAKQQIAASEELSGKRKADQLAAQEKLKVTVDGLEKLEADFVAKNTSFQERTAKREDEILAVQEATEIMNSTEMQKLMDEQYNNTASGPALLQVQQVSRRNALHMLRSAKSPAVALLALRTQTRSMRSTSQADPFAKVTSLLKDMIAKLTKEYAEEATKAQYCESEMARSTKSKFNLEKSADKLKARIAQIDTEVDQLDADIKRIENELKDMSQARTEATTLRKSEQAESRSSIVRYKDAQRLLKSALVVLRKTYGQKPASGGGGGYKVSGIGAGVVGLLEIAVEDFAQLQQETETAEATAAKDYQELMDSTEVKTAAFNKDLEYKNREKVRLEGDKMRAVQDLQNFDKELAALQKYMEQLKALCPKQESYEERKARREEEIRQLQDALTHLTNAS